MLSALKKPLKLLSASEEHARMFSGSRRRLQRSRYPSRCNSPASRLLRARFGMNTRLPSRRLGISPLRAAPYAAERPMPRTLAVSATVSS